MIRKYIIFASFILFPGCICQSSIDPDQCLHEDAILLPSRGKCLVANISTVVWTEAQRTCEEANGTLYQTPNAQLNLDEDLRRCLSNYPSTRFSNLWLDAAAVYFRHFFWINRTLVNEVTYCPTNLPDNTINSPVCSATLSVDYCVSICHQQGIRFVLLYNRETTSCCECMNDVTGSDVPCAPGFNFFNWRDRSSYFIVHSREDSLIRMDSPFSLTDTQVLCATVDTNTFSAREMLSDTCATIHPFICAIGTDDSCPGQFSNSTGIKFTAVGKCMFRSSALLTWWAARAECLNMGGDLWTMHALDDMRQVGQYLTGGSKYWIGATNYAFDFQAKSNSFVGMDPVRDFFKCGHMVLERGLSSQAPQWYFSSTDCTDRKPFLCQYDLETKASSASQDVVCPFPPLTTSFSIGTGVTAAPISGDPTRVQSDDDDPFPLAALLAGLIAGLLLLTCLLALCLFYCCRGKRREKWVERFVPIWAQPAPVVVGSVADIETLSNGGQIGYRSNMSSVSEHGSQVGLVKGGLNPGTLLMSSYGEQNSMFVETKGANNSNGLNSENRKLEESQNYMNNSSSFDERGFTNAGYASMNQRNKEYMTLEAQMKIEDADGLSLRGSMRGKPEVTLVTDNVDMNFTVNHAVSHSRAASEKSRSSLERTMEDFVLSPSEREFTIIGPKRASETKVISTLADLKQE